MSPKNPSKPEKPFWQEVKKDQKKKAQRVTRNSPLPKGKAKARPATPKAKPLRPDQDKPIRLNRFIAQAGICSRRDADTHISRGEIKVNGKVVTELGTKVLPRQDKVEFRGQVLSAQKLVYFLLNKPKNMITTTQDPKGRKIVLDAIERATQERVYPVGRLDRNTTGLLILTNDGELAKRLTHPSHKVPKLYHIRLNKPVPQADLEALLDGIELEDGLARVDSIDYVKAGAKKEVGLEIHSGRNRIVRRMFEHLGYQVEALDRVAIGHLTKKNLPRGKWRKLSPKEVGFLKMM